MRFHPASPSYFEPRANFKGGNALGTVLTVVGVTALAATGFGLAGVGPLAGAFGGAEAAGAAGAVDGGLAAGEGIAGASDAIAAGTGAGLGADAVTGAATAGGAGAGTGFLATLGRIAPALSAAASLGSAGLTATEALQKPPTIPDPAAVPPVPTINQAESRANDDQSKNSARGALANLLQPSGSNFLSQTNTSLKQLLGAG